jgi:PadR family transcriptional regulator AphA
MEAAPGDGTGDSAGGDRDPGRAPSLNDWLVLALVAETPRHGFAVARALDPGAPLGSIWRVARPQVYRSLDRLTRAGLVAPRGTEPGAGGPERVVVAATDAGTRAVHTWATAPVEHLRDVRAELLAKLMVCRRLDLDGCDLLDRQAVAIDAIHHRLDERLATTRGDARLPVLWRLESARAARRFLGVARDWWTDAPATR